ncbi:hypothetical protein IID19_02390 [Patescibacteria group bacterium]|nr:hypothetical protein [Patescibacteria group bacterium]
MEENENKPTSPSTDSNLMAALSYVWVLSIVMLIIKKDDEFVKFHAKQGLILFIASFIGVIPVIGWIIWLGVVVLDIVGFIKALSGEKYKVPIVGDMAEKVKF